MTLAVVLGPSESATAATAGALNSSVTAGIAGEPVRFTGKLPPRKSRPVVLQRKSGDRWVKVAAGKSSRRSRFAFTTQIASSTRTYRVYAKRVTIGGRRYRATVTPTRKITTQPQTGTLDMPTMADAGDAVTATATFTPARPGRDAVLQAKSGDSWATVATGAASSTGLVSFSVPTNSAGTFTYRAVAQPANGAASFTTPQKNLTVAPPPDTTPPPVPTGLAATAGDRHAALTWNAVSAGDLQGYLVYRATTSSGPWTKLTASPITARYYTATGLTNGTKYWFATTAVDATGNESPRSPSASATPIAPPDTTPPPRPSGLTATPADSRVRLAWDAVTAADLAGYRVYRATASSGPWTELTPSTITARTFDATGLTNGTKYWFATTAVDTTGNESARSAVVSAAPSVPTLTHCGSVNASQRWVSGTVHLITCGVSVESGAVIVVEPGAVVKGTDNRGITVNDGQFIADGTATQPVVFTSWRDDIGGDTSVNDEAAPVVGDWSGFEVAYSAANHLTLDNVEIRYARDESTSKSISAGVWWTSGRARVSVTNSAITNAGGIEVRKLSFMRVANNYFSRVSDAPIRTSGGIDFAMLAGNVTDGPNHSLYIAPAAGTAGGLFVDAELPLAGNLVPVIGGTFYVQAELTLRAGAVLKLADTYAELVLVSGGDGEPSGKVIAEGTAADPVVITSWLDDVGGDTSFGNESPPAAGDWGGISVNSRAVLDIDYAHIRYAGYPDEYPSGDCFDTAICVPYDGWSEEPAELRADHSSIEHAGGRTCIDLEGDTSGHFHGVFRNCAVGISSVVAFDARDTDWGSSSGPGWEGNPRVEGPVSTFPWVGVTLPESPPERPLPSPDPNSSCRDYMFIAVRGSGQTSDDHGGMGGQIARVYNSFKNFAAADGRTITTPGRHTSPNGLDYPAYPVPLTTWAALDVSAFIDSAWTGTYSLMQELRRQADSCGERGEKVVLAGYSQGAWVIHATLQYLEARESPLLDGIAAVALLADPLRSTFADPGLTYTGTAKDSNTGELGESQGVARVGLPNAVLSFHTWAAGVFEALISPASGVDNVPLSPGTYPWTLEADTVSHCNDHDPVCGWSFDQANDPDVHTSYGPDQLDTMAEFLADTV